MIPIKDGKVSCPYGKHGTAWSHGIHKGIDYACPAGTSVVAAADGKVTGIGSWGSAFGKESVIIKHDVEGHSYYAIYAHLSKALVKVGDLVKIGQEIGKSGGRVDTPEHKKHDGNTTGPHLHFEVLKQANWSPFAHIPPDVLLNCK